MKNSTIGLFALLSLVGASFAFGGFGFLKNFELPKEADIGLMKAMHEGDYETAKALHEEHIGKKPFLSEEVFSLRTEMRNAINSGDYEKAYETKQKIRERIKENMPEKPGFGFGRHKWMKNSVEQTE